VRLPTGFEGEPLIEAHYAADCSGMSEIGSIGALALSAAQPFTASRAASVDASSEAGEAGAPDNTASGAESPAAFTTDYAASLLAKITHASADQALTLIQGMLPTK
jgi:hypothetical protein